MSSTEDTLNQQEEVMTSEPPIASMSSESDPMTGSNDGSATTTSSWFVISVLMNLVAVLFGLYWYFSSNQKKKIVDDDEDTTKDTKAAAAVKTTQSKKDTTTTGTTKQQQDNKNKKTTTKKKKELTKTVPSTTSSNKNNKKNKKKETTDIKSRNANDILAPTPMLTPEEQREKQKQHGLAAVAHFVKQLGPDSTHLDVLYAIASAPDSIMFGTKGIKMMETLKEDRKQYLLDEEEELQKQIDEKVQEMKNNNNNNSKKNDKSKKKSSSSDPLMFDLDDDGWDQDDDKDEETKRKEQLAAEEEEEKKRIREQIQAKKSNEDNNSTKKTNKKMVPPVEGVDDGVIGQVWMENALSRKGLWPPKNLGILRKTKYEYDGDTDLGPLDHPGLRRNLVMIIGRIHAAYIQKHPDLIKATETQALDPTYFLGSKEFRGRCAMLLEAAFRASLTCRSYSLAKTICETIVIFKIGRAKDAGTEQWFSQLMKQMYQCQPGVTISNKSLKKSKKKGDGNDSEDDDDVNKDDDQTTTTVGSGETMELTFTMERDHAENFTRQKIMMAQQRKIPPQQLLQAHRETWCILVRAKKMGNTSGSNNSSISEVDVQATGMLEQATDEDLQKFRTVKVLDGPMIAAYPLVVQNIAQKRCQVRMQMLAPTIPGKYKVFVSVISQDFFNADELFSLKVSIVDNKNNTAATNGK